MSSLTDTKQFHGKKRLRLCRCAEKRQEMKKDGPNRSISLQMSTARIRMQNDSVSGRLAARSNAMMKRPSRLLCHIIIMLLIYTPRNVPLVDAFMIATTRTATTRSTAAPSCRQRKSRQTRENFPLTTSREAHDWNEKQSISTDLISESLALPKHVAIICDGNSRWAKARGLPAAAGHAAGAERLVQVLQTLQKMGVSYCTLYCFSTENWERPVNEIDDLMRVMEQTARRFREQVLASEARIKVLGDLDDQRIPSGLRSILTQIEDETAAIDVSEPRQTVCLAINYGGRHDILSAAKRLAQEAIASSDSSYIDSLTEDDLASNLGTGGIPDPDLLIRTSGEHRISNFLLWNIAYAEIYFTDTLWPDFDSNCVSRALSWFSRRHRRFGSRETVMNGTGFTP